jgi:nucleoside-diphosphate-sugar epimerase
MERLLIVGCGDIARRVIPLLDGRFEVQALIRDAAQSSELRRLGVLPLIGDLDRPHSLVKLGGSADIVLHCAPPPASGTADPRTVNLIRALSRAHILPWGIVYLSTSGVYGDRRGAKIDESATPAPQTDRARRRLDAETRLTRWGRAHCVAVSILRVPGIYAADRLPLARLAKGTPALNTEDDVYTNHIHADDLARAVVAAIERDGPLRAYNICDDSEIRMGDWFDLVADRVGMPRPPRIARNAAQGMIASDLLSFMSESRRLDNARMKQELGVKLLYPDVRAGLNDASRAVQET